MKISELIERLKSIQEKEGDLKVCTSEEHEYWGTVYNELTESSIEIDNSAQPDGPKSFKSEKALVFGN